MRLLKGDFQNYNLNRDVAEVILTSKMKKTLDTRASSILGEHIDAINDGYKATISKAHTEQFFANAPARLEKCTRVRGECYDDLSDPRYLEYLNCETGDIIKSEKYAWFAPNTYSMRHYSDTMPVEQKSGGHIIHVVEFPKGSLGTAERAGGNGFVEQVTKENSEFQITKKVIDPYGNIMLFSKYL